MLKKTTAMTIAAAALLDWSNGVVADGSVWQALQDGGKVILMRHAAVEQGRGKGNPLLRDPGCAKERNLSSQGREEAAKFGEAFTRRSIRIGAVLASPYCRTLDTAKIAFGQATPAEFLSLLEGLTPEDAAKNTAVTAERIGAYKRHGESHHGEPRAQYRRNLLRSAGYGRHAGPAAPGRERFRCDRKNRGGERRKMTRPLLSLRGWKSSANPHPAGTFFY